MWDFYPLKPPGCYSTRQVREGISSDSRNIYSPPPPDWALRLKAPRIIGGASAVSNLRPVLAYNVMPILYTNKNYLYSITRQSFVKNITEIIGRTPVISPPAPLKTKGGCIFPNIIRTVVWFLFVISSQGRSYMWSLKVSLWKRKN